ncbi:MAG: ABC transporter permease [Atopostipes sp.]|nr:ABC transporter permease [Atopostipes sp.]
MWKRIKTIFIRDLKVNSKDFISLYILVVPILFGILINLFTPGINETTVNLAVVEGENKEQVEYFEQFADVELLTDKETVEERVGERDAVIGVLQENDDYYLLNQGDESDELISYAKLLLTSYDLDLDLEDSQTTIIDFDREIPTLKRTFVNLAILMISILAGMLISLNIVEEKVDNTLSAINLTPTSRLTYLLGKSMIGIIFSILGSLVLVVITGFSKINILQLFILLLVTTLLSIIVGIIQGLNNTDVIGAAGGIKLLFIPLLAGVLSVEFLSDKWQKFFYWDPFYWAYKGNDMILAQSENWQSTLFYSGIIFILTATIFIFIIPQIRKGLE